VRQKRGANGGSQRRGRDEQGELRTPATHRDLEKSKPRMEVAERASPRQTSEKDAHDDASNFPIQYKLPDLISKTTLM
jgi:hypothetical protein